MKRYDDIKTSINKSEITIAIFADFSKAFDTTDFYALIQKMHTFNIRLFILGNELFNFSTAFCTNWRTLTSEFGVPQGFIIGPILINLCVADMSQMTSESECLQYADDTTLCRAWKARERHASINSTEKDIRRGSS